MDGYPEANARHYAFMLEGLAEVERDLNERGIGFVIRRGAPDAVALQFASEAALVVCDRGYLKPQKVWRTSLSRRAPCCVVQVEGDVVVPVETASPKHEVGARTLRPKLNRVWEEYIVSLKARTLRHRAPDVHVQSDINLSDVPGALRSLRIDHSVSPVHRFQGGTLRARARLNANLAEPFAHYAKNRSVPEAGAASHMSPYLHFGQISPVEIALAVRDTKTGDDEDRSAYLEELIVRRELAMNHVFYDERYDTYETVPEWPRKTLDSRRGDPRPYLYAREQLEAGETHDRYWNAAMKEMRETATCTTICACTGARRSWSGRPHPRRRSRRRCGSITATSWMDATRTRSPTWLGCSVCTTGPGVHGPYLGTCARWARTRSRSSMPMLASKRSRNWRRPKEAGVIPSKAASAPLQARVRHGADDRRSGHVFLRSTDLVVDRLESVVVGLQG